MKTTVVVGAGSSGGVVAARLSEDDDQHVILLEAGPDYGGEQDLPEALRDADSLDMTSLYGHDWGFVGSPTRGSGSRAPIPLHRGRMVGGSSAVNAAVAQRGLPEDFAAWAAAGNTEWAWNDVLPVYRMLERDLDFGSSEIHGADGPLPIVRARREDWAGLMHAFETASVDLGHPTHVDANAHDATGVEALPRNLTGSRRAGSREAYLQPARARPNLEIRSNVTVDRVNFAGRRAVGVEARHTGAARSENIAADRVVLCAGVIKTPQILMLSGIGPADQLRRLGIPRIVDLPVGQTLVDHPIIGMMATAKNGAPKHWGPRVELQCTSQNGPRNDIWIAPILVNPVTMGIELPGGASAGVVIGGELGKPRSSGSLHLATSDPSAHPKIELNFLAERADVVRSREIVSMLRSLTTESSFADEIAEIMTPLPDGASGDIDEWLLNNVVSANHGACTCRMGPREDPLAVVNQHLAVHDTEQLFVADASVMPEITTAVVNLTCFMIGERMAEFLRGGD